MLDLYCFSPCGGTKKCAETVAKGMDDQVAFIDLSSPDVAASGDASRIALFAFPVYGGHVPPLVLERLDAALGNATEGRTAVLVATYGNRAFDNALEEARAHLASKGMTVVAGIGAIAQHTLCPTIAEGRPDADDNAALQGFGAQVADALAAGAVAVPSFPTAEEINPYRLGVGPITTEDCIACGICAAECPQQVVEIKDVAVSPEACLGCMRCAAVCPQDARVLPAEAAAMFAGFLGKVAADRHEAELLMA